MNTINKLPEECSVDKLEFKRGERVLLKKRIKLYQNGGSTVTFAEIGQEATVVEIIRNENRVVLEIEMGGQKRYPVIDNPRIYLNKKEVDKTEMKQTKNPIVKLIETISDKAEECGKNDLHARLKCSINEIKEKIIKRISK